MISTKTKLLGGIFLLLLGLQTIEPTPMIADELPVIEGVSKDDISRFEITQLGQKIRFEKENGIWMIKAPFVAKADQSRVKALLLQFRKSISMDVMLERGEEDRYGLDASHSIVMEVWTTASQDPVISFTLGNDAAAGSTFVRLSKSDQVYRARIGGRHRYDFPHEQWKNQVLFDFSLQELQKLEIVTESLQYTLYKEENRWQLDPNPGWVLDQNKTQKVLTRLGTLRIGRIYPEPLPKVDATLRFVGEFLSKEARLAVDDSVIVEIEGVRYQSAASVLLPLTREPQFLRDKHILQFDPRTALDTIAFVAGEQKITLQQDLSNGFWRVLSPQGMDIDLKQVFFMVNSLAGAEAEDFVVHPQEWKPQFSIVLRMLSGEEEILEIGEREGRTYRARKGAIDCILSKEIVEKILRAFGRGIE